MMCLLGLQKNWGGKKASKWELNGSVKSISPFPGWKAHPEEKPQHISQDGWGLSLKGGGRANQIDIKWRGGMISIVGMPFGSNLRWCICTAKLRAAHTPEMEKLIVLAYYCFDFMIFVSLRVGSFFYYYEVFDLGTYVCVCVFGRKKRLAGKWNLMNGEEKSSQWRLRWITRRSRREDFNAFANNELRPT